ncbi:hypothetical protein MA16_Dca011327 [Dendrobium catenatum]|uniref:Membrane protein of ER body-like protein n=1 Tax=Dendrobium catenatum TaxID=906689 RepID=A0A2I0WIR8_9ASPA|nr:hypothetical protein MA16_Dca011327 [Dendrobium catenatum]
MEAVLFTERKWKEKDKDDAEDVNGACGLQRKGWRGFKLSKVTPAMGVEDAAASIAIAGAGEGSRIVYLEEDQANEPALLWPAECKGLWKCRHCSWTYQLLGSGIEPHKKHQTSCQVAMESRTITQSQDDHFDNPMVIVEPSSSKIISQNGQISGVSAPPTTVIIPQGDVQIHVSNRISVETRRENEWEVLKSIVYGGLIESIVSLGVVSSATGAKTSTFIYRRLQLSEIRSSEATTQNDEQSDLYWKLLGRRTNFSLHVTVSLLSYTLFGLLPPLIYSFSSRESTEKLIIVAAASLLCISLLSIGKAHTTEPKSYFRTFIYYLGLGLTASGLSYAAGVMISRFLEQIDLFEPKAPLASSLKLFGADSGLISWASL